MTIQFTKLIRRFEEGKALFENDLLLDAYSNMMHALHHLARLSVIRFGYYPEMNVWEQVRHIDPQTFRLYQELLNSEETLKKRIELLIIATDFAIHSVTEVGTQHFLSIVASGISTLSEFMKNEEVKDYRIDIELLVRRLVENGFLIYKKKATNMQG
ncbi:hypothetical protein, partial [Parasedimentitalea maritima]